ncbi:MAG: hypothetical protein AAGF02_09030 [Actinomycetota bacterium]
MPAEPVAEGAGLDELPELLDDWVAAEFDASIEPLFLAQRIVGFPVAVPVPDASTIEVVSVDGRPGSEDGDWDWGRRNEPIAGPDPGDVDITLDDNGPGAVALRATYDPILAALGFSYSNSTASDPGEPGGPNSVNHVYVAEGGTIDVGGVSRIATPLFVWLDDDVVGFDDGVQTPGFRVDVGAELPEGEIPVTLVAEVTDAVPGIDGAVLDRVAVTSRTRDADSFAAEWGLRYLVLDLSWTLVPAAGLGLVGTIVDALDDPRLAAASENFFEPGTIEPSEPVETSDGWLLDVLLLDRYPGRLSFDGTDDGELRLVLDLEPNRERLAPAPTG